MKRSTTKSFVITLRLFTNSKNEKYLDLFIGLFNDMTKLNYTLDDFLLYLENIDTYNLKLNLSSTSNDFKKCYNSNN